MIALCRAYMGLRLAINSRPRRRGIQLGRQKRRCVHLSLRKRSQDEPNLVTAVSLHKVCRFLYAYSAYGSWPNYTQGRHKVTFSKV